MTGRLSNRIFTDDAVFDLTDLGIPLLDGLERIKQFMDAEAQHPRTHMMTNIYVDETETGVKMFFRIVALRGKRARRHRVLLRRCGKDR